MNPDQLITRTLILNAKPDEVWDALTNPEKIKQYFFNYDVTSDWTKGSAIIWKGKRKGVDVTEKGSIICLDKNDQFKYSLFDTSSGLEDTPDNYLYVTFDLQKKYDKTELALTIENFNEDSRRCAHIAKGWDNTVLPGIRKMFNI
ncbi:MAG: hypothetical protein JWO58_362 [Chitinophagaceae bacterium]|nr:hypothetical protein [Chitinophagaceae bacterium]